MHTVRPVVVDRVHVKGGIQQVALVQYLAARFFAREEGQGLAEYALILALIAIIAIVALIFLGSQVSRILSTVATSI